MKKIDAHNHPYFIGYTPETTIKNMDEYGIDKCILLSCETPISETIVSKQNYSEEDKEKVFCDFSGCLDYYEKAPERFILGYAPDPRKPGALEKLKQMKRDYDIKVFGEVKFRMLYDNPDLIELFRYCGEVGLPVFLHLDYHGAHKASAESIRRSYWYGGDLDTLERVLVACPETIFFGHATCFWANLSNDDLWKTEAYPDSPLVRGGRVEKLLHKYPNLYCDASAGSALRAFNRDKEYTRYLIEEFQDRFVFGRDNFDNNLSEFIDSLGLSEEIREKFYYKNIEKIIGVKA
ncbi:MAG: hypothetical protein E7401_01670 [Ruminococcaceae bacterium]|nr:hypothetical protein [Oscillospiraceae bacterium]